MRVRAGLLAALLLALAACDHSDPFVPDSNGSDVPFQPGAVTRLTYAFGQEHEVAWLPDGSGFLYSYTNPESGDQRDRCLGLMGAEGGRLSQTICDTAPGDSLHTDLFDDPAVGANGQLFYYRDTRTAGAGSTGWARMVVASLAAPFDTTVLRSVPYTLDGHFHSWISRPFWLSDSRLVYLGGVAGKIPICPGCTATDSFTAGKDVVTLDLTPDGPTFQLVPGTENASSFAAVGGSTIYYTLVGDGHIYRRDLVTGTTVPIHDFGSEIVRDVTVGGDRLVAVTGGIVELRDDPNYGQVLYDKGGVLRMVDLNTGAEQSVAMPPDVLARRPVLSPSGDRLVMEGFDIQIDLNGPPPVYDTIVLPESNLWLVHLP